jgi:hypothetical protein
MFPVLDFNARNKEQAYLDTVPPKVKEAIQAHHVLVGMNQEMVLHAKGKPPKKVRERAGETQYEEWIYGEAPADVDFVRFVGDEVVRVETMKVNGEKIVRTEKEVILAAGQRQGSEERSRKSVQPMPQVSGVRERINRRCQSRQTELHRRRLCHHQTCPSLPAGQGRWWRRDNHGKVRVAQELFHRNCCARVSKRKGERHIRKFPPINFHIRIDKIVQRLTILRWIQAQVAAHS